MLGGTYGNSSNLREERAECADYTCLSFPQASDCSVLLSSLSSRLLAAFISSKLSWSQSKNNMRTTACTTNGLVNTEYAPQVHKLCCVHLHYTSDSNGISWTNPITDVFYTNVTELHWEPLWVPGKVILAAPWGPGWSEPWSHKNPRSYTKQAGARCACSDKSLWTPAILKELAWSIQSLYRTAVLPQEEVWMKM